MKKALVAIVVASAFAAGSAFAGSACCPSKSKKRTGDQAKAESTVKVASAEKAGSQCSSKSKGECFSKLNLTTDQQAKVDALMEECKGKKSASECSREDKAKLDDGLKGILTVKQYEQLKSDCDKAGCPLTADTESDEKTDTAG